MEFKLGNFFDDIGVGLVVGGGRSYDKNASDDTHESTIERMRRHNDKVGR